MKFPGYIGYDIRNHLEKLWWWCVEHLENRVYFLAPFFFSFFCNIRNQRLDEYSEYELKRKWLIDSRQAILFRGLKLGAAHVCTLGVFLVDLDVAISVVYWTETRGNWTTCQLNFHIGSTFNKYLKVSCEASCMDISVKSFFIKNLNYKTKIFS